MRRVGRYAVFGEIASGGMATVYLGRLAGAVGFSRSVAIKQLHPQFARSPGFVAQFLDEARLTARIRHPNVISVLDVVARDGELSVIMEFVNGEPLSHLMRLALDPIPLGVISAIMIQVLLGLHAAHEATTEDGSPLEIVHRDVSPQNVLVGTDGVAHILDFGVAKAAARLHTTGDGSVKGKLPYMSPEQLRSEDLDRRADVFAAGVLLWELVVGERLFARSDPGGTVGAVLQCSVPLPSQRRPEVSAAFDALSLKALARDRSDRFKTAREMAVELENCVPPASSMKLAAWVEAVAADSLRERAALLRRAEERPMVNVVVDVAGLSDHLNAPSNSAFLDSEHSALGQAQAASSSRDIPTLTGEARLGSHHRALQPWFAAGGVSAAVIAIMYVTLRVDSPVRNGGPDGHSGAAALQQVQPTGAPAPAVATVPSSVAVADLPQETSPMPSLAPSPDSLRQLRRARPPARPSTCNPPYVLGPGGRKKFKLECY